MNFLASLFLLFFQAGPTYDAAGWTVMAPSVDSRIIYVDPAIGQDGSTGTDPSSPKRTLVSGVGSLRSGMPDHLRLKAGSVIPEAFGRWVKSGRSALEPMVVEVYGGLDRVKIRPGPSSTALFFDGGGGAPPSFSHVIFQSLDIEPSPGRLGSEDTAGIRFVRPVDDILFEDCRVAGFGVNVILQGFDGPLGQVRMRRCVILDAFRIHGPSNAHSQGIYASGIANLTLFECILDHNGWSSVPGAGADVFCHSIYVQNDAGPDFQLDGCVISRSSSHALQARSGGSVTASLFLQNPINILIGGGNTPNPAGVVGTVRGNVILEGNNITPGEPRGWGIDFDNIRNGRCSGNALAHNGGGFRVGISLNCGPGSIGVHDLVIAKNVILTDWGAGLSQGSDPGCFSGIKTTENHFLEPDSIYVDPSRGIPSYMQSLGLTPTTAAYIAAQRAQSRANWNRKLMPYGGVNRHVLSGMVLQ